MIIFDQLSLITCQNDQITNEDISFDNLKLNFGKLTSYADLAYSWWMRNFFKNDRPSKHLFEIR